MEYTWVREEFLGVQGVPGAWTVVVGVWVLSVLVYETVFVEGTVCACVLGTGFYDGGEFCGFYDAGLEDGSEASFLIELYTVHYTLMDIEGDRYRYGCGIEIEGVMGSGTVYNRVIEVSTQSQSGITSNNQISHKYISIKPWVHPPHPETTYFFHFPASSTPLATLLAPSSTPLPMRPTASPTGLPVLPVALLIVSPMPRPAAPVTPPSVRVTPPTVLPTVDVTHLAAPVAPWSELLLVSGIVGERGVVCCWWKEGL